MEDEFSSSHSFSITFGWQHRTMGFLHTVSHPGADTFHYFGVPGAAASVCRDVTPLSPAGTGLQNTLSDIQHLKAKYFDPGWCSVPCGSEHGREKP
jgi:hypothetical protein